MLSVIIPVFNEEDNLARLNARIRESLSGIGEYEVFYVDDHSTDSSYRMLKEFRKADPRVRIIRFKRNYGQHAALAAGFDNCRGDYVVMMDADLQNEPEDVPKIYQKMLEGHDYVSGWRKDRKDPFFSRKLPSKFINIMTSRFTGVKLHDYHCGLKGFSREIVDQMKDFSEMRRCVPALAAKLCNNPTEVVVAHNERIGKSKYNLWGLARVYFDFYIGFSVRPFQFLAVAGAVLMALSVMVSMVYVAARLSGYIQPSPPFLYVMIFTGINSIQLIIFGVLGEYIMRIYRMLQDKSLYKIEETD